jgi:O-antigen/teichoic acid export membrane protein
MGIPRMAGLLKVSGVMRRLGWGVMDQAVSSLTNFAVVFLMAHSLISTDFGAFSLAYLTYGLALNLSRAVASYPLQVRYSNVDIPRWRRAVTRSSAAALLTGLATGSVALAAGLVMHGGLRAAFIGLGLTLPGLLLQDSWRYAFFVLGKGNRAFFNDAIWAVVQLPTMIAMYELGVRSVFWFVLAWGGSASVAAIVGPFQAKVMPRMTDSLAWLVQHKDLGTRYALLDLVNSGVSQLRSYAIVGILGIAVVGYVQAAGTLMGPFMIVFYGAGLVTVPEAVRVVRQSPERLLTLCTRISIGLSVASLLWGALLMVALPRGVGHLALGAIWRPTYPLVPLQVLTVAGQAFSTGSSTGLSALSAAGRTLRATVYGSIAFLICGFIGAITFKTQGTMAGGVISAWFGAFLLWRELRKAAAEHGIPVRGRAAPATAALAAAEPAAAEPASQASGRHRHSVKSGQPVISDHR